MHESIMLFGVCKMRMCFLKLRNHGWKGQLHLWHILVNNFLVAKENSQVARMQ
jgi:hypothetical protein